MHHKACLDSTVSMTPWTAVNVLGPTEHPRSTIRIVGADPGGMVVGVRKPSMSSCSVIAFSIIPFTTLDASFCIDVICNHHFYN